MPLLTHEEKEAGLAKKIINLPRTTDLPFSPAVKTDQYIFVSGQVGFQDPETGKEIKGIEEQCKQCVESMKKILAAAGSSLNDVVKMTVFLRNAKDFAAMNEVYQSYFIDDKPARSTVITGLVLSNMLVEMDCIAYCQSSS